MDERQPAAHRRVWGGEWRRGCAAGTESVKEPYTPILDIRTLDLTNFLDLVNGEKLSLKTDLKKVPGVLPGAPGV